MFYFSSTRRHLRGTFTQKALALIVVSCLFTALLFTGCDTEDDGFVDDHKLNQKLIGTWASEYGDSYTITDTYLSYGYGADFIDHAGTIKYVSNFTAAAGVIIIEYDNDHKPTYYDSFDNYGDPDHIVPLKGNFIGIYYEKLKSGVSVQMADAYVDGGAEEATLDAAKKAFTMGKRGDYIYTMGTYSR